jgi:hypothetical protein
MRKWLIGIGLAAGALALVAAGAAYAASSASAAASARHAAQTMLPMMLRGRLQAMRPGGPGLQRGGPLHDYLVAQIAEALDLTVEEVDGQLAEGNTLVEIAGAQGVAAGDIPALLEEAWTGALAAAVEDGVLTQEQADWMEEHPAMLHMFGARMRGARERGWGPGLRGWNSNDGP